MNKLLITLMLLINLMLPILNAPPTTYAAVDPACDKSNYFLGFPTWYKYINVGPKDLTDNKGKVIGKDPCALLLPADRNDETDWALAAGRIGLAVIEILLRIAGMVSVGFIIYAGIQFVLSEGDPEKAKKARGTIFNSLIGLAIVLVSTAIVNLIGGALIK